jgi:hypothetical protein
VSSIALLLFKKGDISSANYSRRQGVVIQSLTVKRREAQAELLRTSGFEILNYHVVCAAAARADEVIRVDAAWFAIEL